MAAKKICKFIVIDDDLIHIMIDKWIIHTVIRHAQIKTFLFPQTGLKFISEEYGKADEKMPTILLLDINMPGMSGFDFLTKFKNFSTRIREQFKIFIFSSSDPHEMTRAIDHACVNGVWSKPLTKDILKQIIENSDYEI